MSPLALAVLLSLVSAVSYALAAIVQERLASTTAPSGLGLLRTGKWWTAALLQGSGALLHVVALGLGPLTVVQPLGVLTLVLAAPMAALLVRRPVTTTAWQGIVLVSVGLAGILLLTGSHSDDSLNGRGQLALAAAVLGALVLLVGLATAARHGGTPTPSSQRLALRSVSLALAAGVAYGAASVFIKTLAESWRSAPSGNPVPLLALVVVLACTGLATSQASYRGGGLATPLATTTVANPVVAASAGIILLEEGFRYGLLGTLLAVTAGAAASWGLVVLTVDSTRQARTEGPGSGPAGRARKTGSDEESTDAQLRSVVIPRQGSGTSAARRPVPTP
ncbi:MULTISPECIES: DMT family transporter [unclassified Streptomyces]|uniref:DMT family transporter n=1 Tax=unclassified Streptomyces TaxID=2593676 RepID=UPI002DD9E215|nr:MULTISPECIES: DMT family transporter [unclassified Streptomyces]WSA96728.1 DMT family transporter [Streptomyces sp. NBC_01795]WSB81144.1 DMT family transporter [Streptomyces sp. NBC_01775]WSS10647.1 DMT family transporter [Streptomyces sp. NBC_01186]WSS39341.1 DMT family transporter [Streptomyces sp. NBC_01187]